MASDHTSLVVRPPHGLEGGGGDAVEKGLHASAEVEIVEDHSSRLGGRDAVDELKLADPGLDTVGVMIHDGIGVLYPGGTSPGSLA